MLLTGRHYWQQVCVVIDIETHTQIPEFVRDRIFEHYAIAKPCDRSALLRTVEAALARKANPALP